MKLFLSSLSISEEQKQDFINLVDKPLHEISFVLIENAADPYEEKYKGFVLETRQHLESFSMNLKRLDLAQYIKKPVELFDALKDSDVIWVGGGNTYYLRWLMKETGFDTIVHKLLSTGIVYGGGSAGAIVAQKTLKYYDLIDDPQLAPVAMYEGLGLTNIILVPHWNTEGIQPTLQEIKDLYNNDGLEVVTIEDGQALVVNDNDRNLI